MKKSPTDGFVDIHHHLIYGLDDGAQTWEQTQQMLTQAGENGLRRSIATPHAEPGMRPFPMRELMERIRQAREWCIQQLSLIHISAPTSLLSNKNYIIIKKKKK